jgi:hypothetical protein
MENEFNFKNSNVSKPKIELDDFFEFLDPKVVQKIKETSEESRSRILNDINEFTSHKIN